MKRVPELMIIAGSGRNSGKTTLACRLIERFKELNIISLKISPHIHNRTEGAIELRSGRAYSIYRELSLTAEKDTARMLRAGASNSYYIHSTDASVEEAFNWFLDKIANGNPIICESPVLRNFFVPGLFLIADSEMVVKRKDLSNIIPYCDLVIPYEADTDLTKSVLFSDKGWIISA